VEVRAMSLARLVITAVTVEGRSKSEMARDYGGVSGLGAKLVHRFEAQGEAAFTSRSRRPQGNPRAVRVDVEDRIVLRAAWVRPGRPARAAEFDL
jgi:transposase